MILDASNIGKRQWNNQNKYNINIDIQTLNVLCRYVLQDTRIIRMEHLVNIRKLLNLVDPGTYENDPDKIRRIDFLNKAILL